MKTRVTRWLSCLMLIAVLCAASGAVLGVHLCLHHKHDHDPVNLPVRHDGSSCSICLFFTGTTGKYIVAADSTPLMSSRDAGQLMIAPRLKPCSISHRAHICRGPPQRF